MAVLGTRCSGPPAGRAPTSSVISSGSPTGMGRRSAPTHVVGASWASVNMGCPPLTWATRTARRAVGPYPAGRIPRGASTGGRRSNGGGISRDRPGQSWTSRRACISTSRGSPRTGRSSSNTGNSPSRGGARRWRLNGSSSPLWSRNGSGSGMSGRSWRGARLRDARWSSAPVPGARASSGPWPVSCCSRSHG